MASLHTDIRAAGSEKPYGRRSLDAGHAPRRPRPMMTPAARLCHELRQPLQTLVLLQSLLVNTSEGQRSQALVTRLGTALDAMTAILNAHPDATDVEFAEQSEISLPPEAAEVSSAHMVAVRGVTMVDPLKPVVYVIDDDQDVRGAICSVLEDEGHSVASFASCEAFLDHDCRGHDGCILVDAYLPSMSGLELLQRLQASGNTQPAIMITGDGDVPMAVNAMKAGAIDFIEKPIGRDQLLASIVRAIDQSKDQNKQQAWHQDAVRHLSALSARQRQVMELVLAGHPSKNIAADLGISQRTVENHRASIMKRTGTKSLPELARLAVAASVAHPEPEAGAHR